VEKFAEKLLTCKEILSPVFSLEKENSDEIPSRPRIR